jgi:hypothetical protein
MRWVAMPAQQSACRGCHDSMMFLCLEGVKSSRMVDRVLLLVTTCCCGAGQVQAGSSKRCCGLLRP